MIVIIKTIEKKTIFKSLQSEFATLTIHKNGRVKMSGIPKNNQVFP
jgi:hypothetical protein